MDPLNQTWQLFIDWFSNISILVMLVLLYNYIPDRFFIHRDRVYSVYVGAIFSLAALLGIFIPWSGTVHPNIGINGILVPLAGLVGGPISAGIITCVLLLTRLPLTPVGPDIPDITITILAGIIGSLFYLARERGIIRLDWRYELFLLSLAFAILTMGILTLLLPNTQQSGPGTDIMFQVPVIEVSAIIFLGLFMLGSVIRIIDRNKEGEYELISYKEHLEALVMERTADLERINSLQEATIESTSDGIVVTSMEGDIRELNSAGSDILGVSWTDNTRCMMNIFSLLEQKVTDPNDAITFREKNTKNPAALVAVNLTFADGRTYELSVTPHRVADEIIGRVMNFRDITERKFAEEAMRNANQKLLLLSGITRHDILNQITALTLYLHLVREETTDSSISGYLEKMDAMIKTMQMHTEFTSDYQDVGLHEPVWQNPSLQFGRAAGAFSDTGIEFIAGNIGFEIYTDPLLERVFYNLIDNSIRHGEHVSRVSLSSAVKGDDLVIIYADNGTGVAESDKEKIFTKGFGKHTGFGMFLIHEILSITGISIRENGVPGEGVKFEILVPKGKFR